MNNGANFRRFPVVSVLMPVRNAETTVNLAIQSIIEQTFTQWELVVIDDGSTDATSEILKRAAIKDARISIYTKKHQGITHALNLGISVCRAPWIARMDADDMMTAERIAHQISYLEQHPQLDVVSGIISHGGAPGGFALYVNWLNSVVTSRDIELKRFIESPVAHPSVMFRREMVDHHGGYRHGDFPEDYELWLRWLDAGVKFGKVPQPVLTWNDAPTRLTRSDHRYNPEKFYSIKLGYLSAWLRENVAKSREIWLWGAGRVTRKRFASITSHGINIAGYIDIDPKKCGPRRDGLKVVLSDKMPTKSQAFIITGIAKHGARALIQKELEAKGWIEGIDFIHAA